MEATSSFYGSNLLNFDSPQIERLHTAWRQACRRVLGIHPRTHCSLLPCITGDPTLEVKLLRKFVNFLQKALRSENQLVMRCAHMSLVNVPNNVTKNISLICSRFGVLRSEIECGTLIKTLIADDRHPTDMVKGSLIRDLLDHYTDNPEDRDNFDDIISHLCLE